jgi:hypothetical protein
MPKILVIEPCLINFGDDRGGVDHAVGDMPEVNKDTARFLADNGRALYCDERDDPTKERRLTATKAMLKAAEAAAKAAEAAAKGAATA